MVRLVLNRAESQGGVAWQEVKTALDIDIMDILDFFGIELEDYDSLTPELIEEFRENLDPNEAEWERDWDNEF